MINNSKIIFHIDVNSAFLSWTAVKMLREGSRVDIRKIPAVIGGDRKTRHGIVVAKSIPAKKYGIITGEPIANALKKCPNIEIIPPEHGYYYEQSDKLMEFLKNFTPNIEQVSVDECYMDFSSIANSFSTPIQAANKIKDSVREKFGFTVNIGISDVKVLAKMASDFEKPDKVHTLYRDEIEEKMWNLPVSDLYMAGKSSVLILNKLGIFSIGQLAKTPRDVLEAHLKSQGTLLWEFANGIDDRIVNVNKEEAKGVGNSVTLSHDYTDIEDIKKILLGLSDKVGLRLRKAGQMAKTIAVEIKYNDFTKVSRQTTLDVATDASTEIYNLSKELFDECWNEKPVRLLGVRTANLVENNEPEQMSLIDFFQEKNKSDGFQKPSHDKLKKLDEALDKIKNKYGNDTITRASLLKENERGIKDN